MTRRQTLAAFLCATALIALYWLLPRGEHPCMGAKAGGIVDVLWCHGRE